MVCGSIELMNNQLFTFRRCPYAIRARVALYLSDIQYEAIEVDLKNKPAVLIEISPKGTVPVLVTDSGSVIEESLSIVEYALSKKLPSGFTVLSQQQYLQGEEMLSKLSKVFVPSLNRIKYPNRYADVVVAEELKIIRSCLTSWESTVVGRGLISDQYSYYDIAFMPLIRQLFITDAHILDHYPLLSGWLEAWISSPCMDIVMQKK